MLGEALVGKIADVAVSAVWVKVAQGSPKSLKVRLKDALKVALVVALAKTLEQYPEQDETLILENFLRHEGASVIAKVLTPETPPTGEELAQVWANRFEAAERDILTAQMIPLCTTFLSELRRALTRSRLLQEDPLVRDLLTLDATSTLNDATVTLPDQSAAIEANSVATQQELAALGEEIQRASQSVDKALTAWLDTSAVLNRLLDAQLQGVKRFNYTYASRVRRFLREYLGSGSDIEDADERVPFGGRDSELQKLTDWLENGREKYFLLVAKAGRGKSALLARWLNIIEQRGEETTIFVPISIRFETAAASIFMAILASRLAELHGEKLPNRPTDAENWKNLCHSYLTRPIPDGRRVVVVLDGLDEAEPGMVTGSLLPHPDDLSPTVRILISARLQMGDTSPANWITRLGLPGRQVKTFDLPHLTHEGLEDVLMKWGNPLRYLKHDHTDIVKELFRVTEGDPLLVNLYVKELLELGQGIIKLAPTQLSTTPKGLGGFFDLWRNSIEKEWGSMDNKLILSQTFFALRSLLAGARGPIYFNELLKLTETETSGVGDILRRAMLPLTRFLVGDGREQGFVFSHPRFADYIWEEQLSAMERAKWSQRFVDYGATVLRTLKENPRNDSATVAESFRYALQYYREHLDLLLSNTPIDSYYALLCHEWAEAWFALRGTYDGFLTDVARIWERAREDTLHGDRIRGISKEIFCALCQSSIIALSSNIEPDLLVMAVQARLYTSTQAFVLIRQMASDSQKVTAIKGLFCTPDISDSLRHEILDFVRTIQTASSRAYALREIAQHFEGDKRASLLQEALEITRTIQAPLARASALQNLAEHYKGDIQATLLQEALETSRTIQDDLSRVFMFRFIADHYEGDRRVALLREELEIIRNIQNFDLRMSRLCDIALQYQGNERAALLQEVLEITRTIQDKQQYVDVLRKLSTLLPLADILEMARSIPENYYRTSALRSIAPLLPVQDALEVARSIQDKYLRTSTLIDIAQATEPAFRPTISREALKAARTIEGNYLRATAIRDIAQQYQGSRRTVLLQEALGATYSIREEHYRTSALQAIALLLPLQDALKIANTIKRASSRTRTLLGIAQQHQVGTRSDVLQKALESTRIIQDHSSQATAVLRVSALLPLQEVLDWARAIQDDSSRATALQNIAQQAPAGMRASLLHEALDAARSIQNDFPRAYALCDIAPLLPLQDALVLARSIQDRRSCAAALIAIAKGGERSRRPAILHEALETARSIPHDYYRITTILAITQQYEGNKRTVLLREALDSANAMQDEDFRADCLKEIAPHLPLQDALKVSRSIKQDYHRAIALYDVARHLDGDLRKALVHESLDIARTLRDEYDRNQALRLIGSLLPLQDALKVAHSIKDIYCRATALLATAHHVGHGSEPALVHEALVMSREIKDTSGRTSTLNNIVELLTSFDADKLRSPHWLYECQLTIQNCALSPRSIFLKDLAALTPLLFVFANADTTFISTHNLYIREKQVAHLKVKMIDHLDLATVARRRNFLENAGLHHLEKPVQMELPQQDFVPALLRTVQAAPAENGVTAMEKLLRQLAVEWAGDEARRTFVEGLLGEPRTQDTPSTRLAGEIFKAIQDVTSWWP